MEEKTIVSIHNLVKRYGDVLALDHLDLEIKRGEIYGLLGPNGSGKTTAINCLLALLGYDKGSIRVFTSVRYLLYLLVYTTLRNK